MSVAIINMALDLLEEEPILSPDDDRTAVRWMNRNYASVRDALLRQHPWNFARTRASLPALSSIPAFGWAYQYALPADCLRVLPLGDGSLTGTSVPYVIEGRNILTNASSPLKVMYVRRVDDDTEMDPMFVQVLAASLGARAASFITGKSSYMQMLQQMVKEGLLQAQLVDSLEGTPQGPEGEDWLTARQSSWGGYYSGPAGSTY